MKKVFSVLLVSLFLGSCIKVQKRSDLITDDTVEQNNVQAQPTRYRFDTMLDLQQDMVVSADEVYMSEAARIYTNQYSLKINARRLVIEQGALIQTVSKEKSKASIEVPGFDGGMVKIKTEIAEGYLTVNMNGQSGGDGLGGWTALEVNLNNSFSFEPGRTACAPNSGADAGKSGSFFLEANQSKDLFVVSSVDIASGGLVGPVATDRSIDYLPDYAKKYKHPSEICTNTPYPGRAGEAGVICIKYSAAEYPQCKKY